MGPPCRGGDQQGADRLVESFDDLKPADVADALQELTPKRRREVAEALPDEKLADVLEELPEEDRGRYNTLAGMIMLLLGRLPRTADKVEWGGWLFEVVDLDGKRVDKVLVSRLPPNETETDA